MATIQDRLRIYRANGLKTIFQEFIRLEAAGGVLLILFTFVALLWANSPLKDTYTSFWHIYFTISLGEWILSKPLILWVNDGLMAIFFFVVGLEIKREILTGELASVRRAALPIAAAIGGMLFPALAFVAVTFGQPGAGGWGIPMATDIAFTLGLLALLGTRAPLSLKVFVTALAIVDDIGAVLVIAIFYSDAITWSSLLVAGLRMMILLFGLNRLRVNTPLPYTLLGFGLWLAFLFSGVHATIAGVLLAMTIPARAHADQDKFVSDAHEALDDYESAVGAGGRQDATHALEVASHRAESLLQKLEHDLHPWVVYVIMPVFALANAGVTLSVEQTQSAFTSPLALGILAGLVIGKPLGVSLMSWLALKLGLAELPRGITMRHIIGAGFLSGVGFTMSLFIANLAFDGTELLGFAKVAILTASFAAGALGWLVLSRIPQPTSDGALASNDLSVLELSQ